MLTALGKDGPEADWPPLGDQARKADRSNRRSRLQAR